MGQQKELVVGTPVDSSAIAGGVPKMYEDEFAKKLAAPLKPRKYEIIWRNVAIIGTLHLFGIYGLWLFLCGYCKWQSLLYMLFQYQCAGLGITAGVHRLWSHRSYKAKWPLRLMLMIFNTHAFQGTIIFWAKDHRVHHKYTDTDADPYNAARGFIFSHFGWTITKRLPEVDEAIKRFDFADLYNDPFVVFQKRHYWKLSFLIVFLIPTLIPVYFWGETVANAFFFCACFTWVGVLFSTWCVNSVAHILGHKPYDKGISPRENAVIAYFAMGEGWHNYHHSFPSDYKTAELGHYSLNVTKLFIDIMAKIGWAYDLKTVSPETVQKRMLKTGDGTHASIWGEVVGDDVYDKSHEKRHMR